LCYVDGGQSGTEIHASPTLTATQGADLESRLQALATTSTAGCALDQGPYTLVVRHGDGSSTTFRDDLGGIEDYSGPTATCGPAAVPGPYADYTGIEAVHFFLENLTR